MPNYSVQEMASFVAVAGDRTDDKFSFRVRFAISEATHEILSEFLSLLFGGRKYRALAPPWFRPGAVHGQFRRLRRYGGKMR